ncbi:methylated-DNA-[protein]-cysteine S-methyltransferase [Anaerocolumna jejuensis DSM 15929]|uniref:Methylated-DNA--protein-cysteine methyltransferase n=1 Tax=Anaerocolumna jejuensis DSM 15929 TaxID=1121322 RepID=A0A1M6VE77_9FIRM|nr:methylated-DNA--[protein]-cysteine S-methyltransferase [Anaerocolumna jejuensis]SHK79847.1 methylated-DNA-[protein]-cysteine S-methyltransferase [Anaerocolumna jejuensis DSM 15929]
MSRYAFYDFEFGILKIGYSETAITYLKRAEKIDADNEPSALSDRAFDEVCAYLKGTRRTFDFPYELKGTEFQKKVWKALLQIPYGETRTYKQIAEEAGSPKGSRAIGMANNKNPVTIAVPCHRVIGTDGRLVGYAGGLEMKKFLLELEQSGKIS